MARVWRLLKRAKNWWREGELNRREVGTDMFGNTYYQNYDDQGLPLRRSVEYLAGWRNATTDPVWYKWLNGSDAHPPTPEEVLKAAEDYQRRKEAANQWDAREEEMMSRWRDVYKRTQRTSNEPFKPESWNPSKPSK